MDDRQMTIHFDGWSEKYDETLPISSQRLSPFRLHTDGYTGQPRSAYRDFRIEPEYHNLILSKMQEMRETQFDSLKTASEVNQFLRGEWFFYVDSIISITHHLQRQELQLVYSFMQESIATVLTYFETYPKIGHFYSVSKRVPKAHLIDKDCALAKAGFEMICVLEKCFGLCK